MAHNCKLITLTLYQTQLNLKQKELKCQESFKEGRYHLEL